MSKVMACICGWVSEAYPDTWIPFGLGGVLDCPVCRSKFQNATLEGCYGHVIVITLEELAELREQESRGVMWEQAWRNLQRKRLGLECKHYDREEINEVLDGKIPPITRCKDCGEKIPVLLTTPFYTTGKTNKHIDLEKTEDKIRKMKRKSIRNQGKYGHARGKEKKREP